METQHVYPQEEFYADLEMRHKLVDALNLRLHDLVLPFVVLVIYQDSSDEVFGGGRMYPRVFASEDKAIEWAYNKLRSINPTLPDAKFVLPEQKLYIIEHQHESSLNRDHYIYYFGRTRIEDHVGI